MMKQSTPSPFVNAMDKASERRLGENGAAELTSKGVEESRVALFFALVRDLPQDRFEELFQLVIADSSQDRPEVVADLFLLAFQTRNCRGGKGEKDLFYRMIMELSIYYPRTVESLMRLIPHYGSYKDWFKLVALARKNGTKEQIKVAMLPIVNTIMDLAAEQLLRDKQALEQISDTSERNANTITLLAKWAPRENKHFGKQVRVLANKLFPDSKAPKKEYRQLVSKLNRTIQTVEISMCANRYNVINPIHIPSRCMMKHRKAFLNEKVGGPPPCEVEEETGNRHPRNMSRVECRKRLRKVIVDSKVKKLKGRQLFPHEVVNKIMHGHGLSGAELDVFQCQWDDIVQSVKAAIEAKKAKDNLDGDAKEEGNEGVSIDLGKVVALVDVSGSMSGTPMDVAIALGILVSEVASPEFSDRCITFHANPSWVKFDSEMSMFEKVQHLKRAPWGMNTDFEKATEMILKIAVEAKLEPDDIPDLIVFSDMQFDSARTNRNQNYETHHERIVRCFKEEGLRVCGREWNAPHIVYWNLRGATNGFPVQGDIPNVTMLSGYSPSLLKLLLNGDPLMSEEEGDIVVLGEGEHPKRKKNPYNTVRKALDDEDYNLVRRVLSESNEGLLQFYEVPEDAMVDPHEEEANNDIDEIQMDDSASDWELVK